MPTAVEPDRTETAMPAIGGAVGLSALQRFPGVLSDRLTGAGPRPTALAAVLASASLVTLDRQRRRGAR